MLFSLGRQFYRSTLYITTKIHLILLMMFQTRIIIDEDLVEETNV